MENRTLAACASMAVMLGACNGAGSSPDPRSLGCPERATVFLLPGLAAPRQRRVGEVIESLAGVERAAFHPSSEAFADFKRLYRSQSDLYKGMGPDDFPSRYEVALDPSTSTDRFETSLQGTVGIDKIVGRGCRAGAGGVEP